MEQPVVKKRKKKGFTLIELIIVLAIIAIIAAIAIPNFVKVRQDSKEKADTQSCETIKRIALTMLAEDKLPVSKTINITFESNKIDTDLENGTENTKINKDELLAQLKDVKKPQEDGATKYIITISPNGDVTVKTDKTATTDAP